MNRFYTLVVMLILNAVVFLNGCKKEDPIFSPAIITTTISSITETTAISGGNISDDGGAPVLERGVCWSAQTQPTIADSKTNNGTGIGNFTSNLTELLTNTTYFVRAYATNSSGTYYGNEVSFTTPFVCGISMIKDIEGNAYHTVSIGSQCWIKENLRTSTYNDGIAIATGLDNTAWIYSTVGAYTAYPSNEVDENFYGKIYNWYAIETGKLCPIGWHVPTDDEWTKLVNYLGGSEVAGGKMKATSEWQAPNSGATNSSGFSGLPGGFRFDLRTFPNIGYYGNWWSATANGEYASWARNLGYSDTSIGRSSFGNVNGFSCRCVRD
jgi:uncharacterized protein (TIGR02145 family)